MRFEEVAVDDLDPPLYKPYKSMRYSESGKDSQGKIGHLLKTHYELLRDYMYVSQKRFECITRF